MADDDRQRSYERLESELTEVWRRGSRISSTLARRVHPGLDGSGYSVLIALDTDEVVRAADLVTRFGVDKSTISRQLAHLESLGLVERAPDEHDRRALVVRLTATGQERVRTVRDARRTRIRGVFDDWAAADIDVLGELLGRLNADLNRIS